MATVSVDGSQPMTTPAAAAPIAAYAVTTTVDVIVL